MKLVRTGVGVTGTGNTGIGVRGTSNNICVRGDGDGFGVVGGSTIGTGVAPFGPSLVIIDSAHLPSHKHMDINCV